MCATPGPPSHAIPQVLGLLSLTRFTTRLPEPNFEPPGTSKRKVRAERGLGVIRWVSPCGHFHTEAGRMPAIRSVGLIEANRSSTQRPLLKMVRIAHILTTFLALVSMHLAGTVQGAIGETVIRDDFDHITIVLDNWPTVWWSGNERAGMWKITAAVERAAGDIYDTGPVDTEEAVYHISGLNNTLGDVMYFFFNHQGYHGWPPTQFECTEFTALVQSVERLTEAVKAEIPASQQGWIPAKEAELKSAFATYICRG
ncbi:hypothetical protein DFH06DRAFT_673121 [Mycena polygramma]|nr:hypothetical protein DFH06DRAFT_673121 [Mycena polygramma]